METRNDDMGSTFPHESQGFATQDPTLALEDHPILALDRNHSSSLPESDLPPLPDRIGSIHSSTGPDDAMNFESNPSQDVADTNSGNSNNTNNEVLKNEPSPTIDGNFPIASTRTTLAPNTPSKKQAMVNARGMWKHWTLLFRTPLLAFHDLLDNCVDATQLRRDSRVYIDADHQSVLPGIQIVNNSVDRIVDLAQILSPYSSRKDGDAVTIGQSGIGLKQASAMLSDLNFVLVRNLKSFELGIIALSLQPQSGDPSFPSFTLPVETREDLESMLDNILDAYPEIAECVRHYGNGHLQAGRNQLVGHFMAMSSDETGWSAYDHVFTLLITDLRHRHTDAHDEYSTSNHQRGVNPSMSPVEKFLSDVEMDMPLRYLSIPVDVRVSTTRIVFNYWQSRLVELTQFVLPIHRKKSIVGDQRFRSPPVHKLDENGEPVAYNLRVYAGFDTVRMADVNQAKHLSLYIYSRKSGRLVEMKEDARAAMGITAGGTEYSQGLTVIIDDYNGNLMLNPNKTEITFGRETHGQTHCKNLYAWLSVATRVYYDYCKESYCDRIGGEKGILSDLVRGMGPKAKEIQKNHDPLLAKPMHECVFSRFSEVASSVTARTGKIRKVSRPNHIPGPDTKLVLRRIDPSDRKKQEPSQTRKAAPRSTNNNYNLTSTIRMSPVSAGMLPGTRTAPSVGTAAAGFARATASSNVPGNNRRYDVRGFDNLEGFDDHNGSDYIVSPPARKKPRFGGSDDSFQPGGRHSSIVSANAAPQVRSGGNGGKSIGSLQQSRINQLSEENENLQMKYKDLKAKSEETEKLKKALRKKYRRVKEDLGEAYRGIERLDRENEELKAKNQEQHVIIKRLQANLRRRQENEDSSDDNIDFSDDDASIQRE